MKEISIRQATIDDIDTIVCFNKAMAMETEGLELPHQRLKDGVMSALRDVSKGFYVVAECNNKVIGQTMITYEWSDWRNGVFWWIQSVYVIPEHRKSGVFRYIFEHIQQIAANTPKVCGFRLYVEKNNIQAKHAYRSLGMKKSHYELYEKID